MSNIRSAVSVKPANSPENNINVCFKTTPVSKVILLSFLTGGFYDLILVFNYWKTIRDKMGRKISPFWRCIFAPLTNYRLFPIFQEYFSKFNVKISNASLLATVYFGCGWGRNQITSHTFSLEQKNYFLEFAILIFCLVTALIWGSIQDKINKVNEQNFPNAEKNPWKVSNIIWAIIFAITTCLNFLPK